MEMIAKQRIEKPAPLRSLVPDVPQNSREIIHRLLEKDPERRIRHGDGAPAAAGDDAGIVQSAAESETCCGDGRTGPDWACRPTPTRRR